MKKISHHPVFTHADEIQDICKPLHHFGITYFGHVVIDRHQRFAAIANNPAFSEHYIKNKYYNADIHLAETDHDDSFILWDAIEILGDSAKMNKEAIDFGVDHTFTIIKMMNDEKHYFHFSTATHDRRINQVYLTNMDLLNQFTDYFRNQISEDSALRKAYTITFEPTIPNEPDFILPNNSTSSRDIFLTCLNNQKDNNIGIVTHKNKLTYQILPIQQMKCFQLLQNGASVKQIAKILKLSPKTIEHYLAIIRKKLHCQTSRELISTWTMDVNKVKSPY